jgi:hypothetical protein
MVRKSCALILALVMSGCFANVTTMKITRNPNGSITIDSGKDVAFKTLHFEDAGGKLDVAGYSSNANSSTIDAQTARETAQFQGINSILQTAITAAVSAAAKGAGKP